MQHRTIRHRVRRSAAISIGMVIMLCTGMVSAGSPQWSRGHSFGQVPTHGQSRLKPVVYLVSSGGDAHVVQFRVDPGGRLVPLRPPVAPTGYSPASLAVTPNGRFAYVADETEATVSEYRIGTDGALHPLQAPRVRTGAFPSSLAVSADGKSVYVANHGGTDYLCEYRVGVSGALETMRPPTVPTGELPDGITLAPGGRCAYVTYSVDHDISLFRAAADGHLIPLPKDRTMPLVDSPPVFAPHSPFAYVHLWPSGRVAVCDVRPDGSLARPRVAIPQKSDMVALTPDGRFACVAEVHLDDRDLTHLKSRCLLRRYRVRPDGTLAALRPQRVPNGILMDNPVFSPDGRYAFLVYSNIKPHDHHRYLIAASVSPNGSLGPLRFPGRDVGKNNMALAFLLPTTGAGEEEMR